MKGATVGKAAFQMWLLHGVDIGDATGSSQATKQVIASRVRSKGQPSACMSPTADIHPVFPLVPRQDLRILHNTQPSGRPYQPTRAVAQDEMHSSTWSPAQALSDVLIMDILS